MKESFNILSPDGFPIERDKVYSTPEKAWKALEEWMERYKQQGYYSMSNRERLPLDEIKENCTLIKN